MKKLISIFVFIILLGNLPTLVMAQEDLLGIINRSDLQEMPHASWYNDGTLSYSVDDAALAGLGDLLEGIEIKVAMGTWCHDSKREIPRFYKILRRANVSDNMTQLIALDRKKQAPNGEIEGLAITNTPTFIFYKDGIELNRIVERPVESLERDMMRILSGEEYRHSKMP